ncbi:MAG: efflux RND transporter periplasmic adaptor subunit [Bacteroidota bacterium]|nr:efflux RND transporter periplasmic adaptor subunit [Bacteroidota bacterium]
MKKKLSISIATLVLLGVVGWFLYPTIFPSKPERKILYWTDPMLPGDRSDHPGKSPMGMERTPVYADETQTETTSQNTATKENYYTCPMHPSVVSDRPGACPVCHMDLVKKSAQLEASDAEMAHLKAVSLSPTQRIIANVSTSTVERRDLSIGVDAVGVVDVAEPLQSKVTARFRGRIEKLHVNFTGEIVKKGQPLFELYSPDLVSAQQELILASNTNLLDATRSRLRVHFGLTEKQISEIEQSQNIKSSIAYHSPISGTVLAKSIQEGDYVDEGTVLYQLADLSNVWIYLDVYEKDINELKLNQSVKITSEAYPNEIFTGKVTFIDPTINPETRTIRVRTAFKNPNGKLKPQMYVKATILETTKKALTIPASAVLYSGKRNVVWTEIQTNIFEPRDVVLGATAGKYVEVKNGLSEGETIVTTGGYLIDSESQLKQSGTPAGHEGHQTETSKDKNAQTAEGGQTPGKNEFKITIKYKYIPDVIHAKKGEKIRIAFYRDEDSKCTDEVIFEELNIRKQLPAFKTTVVEFTPTKTGEIIFTCGMKMITGKVVVHE